MSRQHLEDANQFGGSAGLAPMLFFPQQSWGKACQLNGATYAFLPALGLEQSLNKPFKIISFQITFRIFYGNVFVTLCTKYSKKQRETDCIDSDETEKQMQNGMERTEQDKDCRKPCCSFKIILAHKYS